MLSIENLAFGYQYRPILRKLSFRVEPGEILHIQGPNGCGKTTLMSIIAGLRREHAGSIQFHGHAGQLHPDRRQILEYLPAEANALYGKMDAMQNLRFWLGLRGRPSSDELIVSELSRWDLSHPLIRKNFPVESFSTGMKRRLALARVNLSGTPCWLLDEPLYGLDTRGIQTFQDILRKHLSQGGLALVVSHDTAPFAAFSVRTLDLAQEKKS